MAISDNWHVHAGRDCCSAPAQYAFARAQPGWECPNCGSVWAPHVVKCQVCPAESAPEFLAKTAGGEPGE